ncbi:MAG TPA: CBS domain-containing protein [Nitrososphaerales archaeon]|nr:CBS domain-containing protein [Nitrososphaerales archaeon]
MLLPPTQEIKKRRVALGISQKKLANSVGASQSLVAKIESNRVRPSYDIVKKIFEYLDRLEQPRTGLARDVEKRDLVWIRKNERVREAAEKMRQYGFSQLPVRDDREDICVGSLSERHIVQSLLKEPDPKAFYDKPVVEVMQEQFPVVDESIPITAVALLLQHSQAVLTARKGKVVGIITASDLLSTTAEGSSSQHRRLAQEKSGQSQELSYSV